MKIKRVEIISLKLIRFKVFKFEFCVTNEIKKQYIVNFENLILLQCLHKHL